MINKWSIVSFMYESYHSMREENCFTDSQMQYEMKSKQQFSRADSDKQLWLSRTESARDCCLFFIECQKNFKSWINNLVLYI